MSEEETPRIGVIGGSGLYSLFGAAEEVVVKTPYGETSSPLTVGRLGARRVAFMTRHGPEHTLPPHALPYRANLWAMAQAGVETLVTSSAVGGLSVDLAPGTFVVPDQLLDLTGGRRCRSFFDGGRVEHVQASDPFDADLRAIAVSALRELQVPVRASGTCVVIPGPRFSTRAESRAWAMLGGSIVNMTLEPETTLALELGMRVVNLSFVTDSDAAVPSDHEDAVDADVVLRRLAEAQPVIRAAIAAIVAAVPADGPATARRRGTAVSELLALPVIG